MKKFCIIFCLLFIIILTAAGYAACGGESASPSEYLRIHIRANSNDEKDQAVKYIVRDEIVEYLTSIVAEANCFSAAAEALKNAEEDVRKTAEEALIREGFSYSARAEVKREYFPTRIYEGLTLSAGEYLALIIELGEGAGDNWWCVAYPPLCFTGSENVVYKSKIAEIITSFFNNKK